MCPTHDPTVTVVLDQSRPHQIHSDFLVRPDIRVNPATDLCLIVLQRTGVGYDCDRQDEGTRAHEAEQPEREVTSVKLS